MAGEMSREEVTRESYPDLFALMDELKAAGIESEPRPFDQYQGPYLYVPGLCRVWYDGSGIGDSFVIERGHPPINSFETVGADFIPKTRKGQLRHGVYYVDSAAARIAQLARKKAKR